ncbi:MAG: exosome complex RNA-binding protein Csl4 [Candidatus Caldarchaeum sp.]|nr:exosome complex RNA-binding protein Csl4 [Candidatus Caldarchaeum sp.]
MEKIGADTSVKRKFVVPGEVLCVAEEYLPLEGVFADEGGFVKSRFLGEALYNLRMKEVKVLPVKEIVSLGARDRVIAEVRDVQERIAVAEAFVKLPDKPMKYRRMGVILGRRNEALENIVGIGDITVLNVVNVYRGLVTFDIYSPGCGVMLAMCSVCGNVLDKRDSVFVCGRCGSRERRKTVLKYGNLQVLKQLMGVEK